VALSVGHRHVDLAGGLERDDRPPAPRRRPKRPAGRSADAAERPRYRKGLSYQIVTTKLSSGPETRLTPSVTVCETSPAVAVVSVVVTWLFEVPTPNICRISPGLKVLVSVVYDFVLEIVLLSRVTAYW
jgi:hypothetical protein